MAGRSRRRTIILLPFICVIFIAGWILNYFALAPKNPKPISMGILNEQTMLGALQKHLENAIIEQREGIMLGFLGVFALTPFILFGGFPSWMYISAAFFTVLGSTAMFHGSSRKTMIKKQLAAMTMQTLR